MISTTFAVEGTREGKRCYLAKIDASLIATALKPENGDGSNCPGI